MTFKNIALVAISLLAFVGVDLPRAFASNVTPIPCSKLTNLRDLAPDLIYYTNPHTGDQLDYVVIGDGAVSKDVLVFFPGTSQILPDWPLQMITNSKYSPNIVTSLGYSPTEDGPVSLCHNYHLLLFDYPGVGENPLKGQVTKDAIANDVDGILQDAAKQYGISTDVVDPTGWSLGTTDALKFSLLSPASRPERKIRNVLLIATDPGGYTNGLASPDEASCIGTLFDTLETSTGTLTHALQSAALKLTFPYAGQTSSDYGTNSGCTATVAGDTVDLSVTPNCTVANHCVSTVAIDVLNRKALPWSLTGGVNQMLYVQQRSQGKDWAGNFCKQAAPGFASEDCHSYGEVNQSIYNGGVCKTNASNLNSPVTLKCAHLKMTGHIAVFNGYQDLYGTWTYGRALVEGYNAQYGRGSATLSTYPGPDGAGHGVMFQHPLWMQDQIHAAFDQRGSRPRAQGSSH